MAERGLRRLEIEEVTKRFGDLLAVDRVSLSFEAGTVHGLVGENGAGKTTLMRLVYGIHQPDAGALRVDGRPVQVRRPRDAVDLGIAMVHQHEKLVPAFTVAENLVLARRWDLGLRYRRRQVLGDIARLSERYGLEVRADARVADLSLAARQRAEILAALYRQARMLILDEPTTVLSPPEIERLLGIVRSLADDGRIVVFISHRLREVFAVTDTVSVLRRGRLVGTWPARDTTADEVATAMVGAREAAVTGARGAGEAGRVVLRLEGVTVEEQDDYDRPGLHDVSLELREGEVLGVAGVQGNGQAELIEVLLGIARPSAGAVVHVGAGTSADRRRAYAAMISERVGVIPEDRQSQGLVLPMDVAENLVLGRTRGRAFSRLGVLRRAGIRTHARGLMQAFDIRAPSEATGVAALSGGNQQKVVLARAMDRDPAVLVAAEPTRGLDLGAAAYVLRRIAELRAAGTAVLYISSDLDELLAMSDRVVVLFRGEVSAPLFGAVRTVERIGALMAGLSPVTAAGATAEGGAAAGDGHRE